MSRRNDTATAPPGPLMVDLGPRRAAAAPRYSTTDLRRTQLASVDRRGLRPSPVPETPDEVEEILYDVLDDI